MVAVTRDLGRMRSQHHTNPGRGATDASEAAVVISPPLCQVSAIATPKAPLWVAQGGMRHHPQGSPQATNVVVGIKAFLGTPLDHALIRHLFTVRIIILIDRWVEHTQYTVRAYVHLLVCCML